MTQKTAIHGKAVAPRAGERERDFYPGNDCLTTPETVTASCGAPRSASNL